jgi:hypothetical protein
MVRDPDLVHDDVPWCAVDENAIDRVRNGLGPRGVRADQVPRDEVAARRGAGNQDAPVPGIARDHVQVRGRSAADHIVGRILDPDSIAAVPDRRRPGHVGADEVADDPVAPPS